jgi:flagellar biosynthesis GTPase FlhF
MAAYNRKVTVTPDSIDALMLEMREKGFSDQQISGKLAKDCGVVYNVKSISTRIMRIRLAQTENTDFLLKEGSKEWQFEDVFTVSGRKLKTGTNSERQDTTLLQAYALADIEVNYEIERTRAWRFRKVSEYMRRLNKDALFSANACRERYNALIEGKARIPSEVDDDPEARRAEMAARRRECEKARLEEETEKEAQAALKKKRKQEAAAQSAQKAEELANKRMAKEADKAERVKQKAEKAQERAQRALEIQQKQQANSSRVKGQTAVATDSATSQKTVAPTKKPTVPFSRNTPDPRSSLSLPDLRNLCVARGLKVNGKTEEMLLSDIQDAEHKWKLYKLKEMCSSKGLPTSGTKALLRHRLALSSVNEFALSDL